MKRLGIAMLVLVALAGGCVRQVVVDPTEVARIDKGRWEPLADAPGGETKGAPNPAPGAGQTPR